MERVAVSARAMISGVLLDGLGIRGMYGVTGAAVMMGVLVLRFLERRRPARPRLEEGPLKSAVPLQALCELT
jgi:hypothetical protein